MRKARVSVAKRSGRARTSVAAGRSLNFPVVVISMPITVSIVEDHQQTRNTIESLLCKSPNIRCLATYPTAEAALAGVPSRKPNVLLVDIRLPRMSGIECVARLKSQMPDLQ